MVGILTGNATIYDYIILASFFYLLFVSVMSDRATQRIQSVLYCILMILIEIMTFMIKKG